MKSQPLNPEFRSNPENFHPCSTASINVSIVSIELVLLLKFNSKLLSNRL